MTSARSDHTAELLDRWLAEYGSMNTRAAYAADLARFGEWCAGRERAVLNATTTDVAAYLASTNLSPATRARRRSALSSFFTFAVAAAEAGANPVAMVEAAPEPERSATAALTADDASALLRAADRRGAKTAVLVRMLMLDGLRLNEILAADAADFSAASAELAIDRRDRRRTVVLSRPTARRLLQYLGRRRRGPLLVSDTPGRADARLTRFGADYLLKEAARAAGLAPLSANTLRRRCVAAAAMRGMHLDDIRDQLGHRDARTTRRYLEPESLETDRR